MNATSVVLKHGLVPVLGGHGAVALENWLGVVAAWEIVSVPVPAANCAAVAGDGGYRRVRRDAVADDDLPDARDRREGSIVDCRRPVEVVAPRLVSVTISLVFVDVALADIVSDVGGDPVMLVT